MLHFPFGERERGGEREREREEEEEKRKREREIPGGKRRKGKHALETGSVQFIGLNGFSLLLAR